MTKIEWISISGTEGRNAIDNFINSKPNPDIRDTIELGTDIGIIYNEGRGGTKPKKTKAKAKKEKETKGIKAAKRKSSKQ